MMYLFYRHFVMRTSSNLSKSNPSILSRGNKDPFILTSILARLGKALGVKAVIVDLRAGLSELSTGLLLDPRVSRILITTLSSQSVSGTCHLLKLLGELAPSNLEDDPLPAIIVNQVLPEYQQGMPSFARYSEQFYEASRIFWEKGSNPILGLPILTNEYDSKLMMMPSDWDEAIARLEQTGVIERLGTFVDWLPLPDLTKEYTIEPSALKMKRSQLADFSGKLIYAERGDIQDFLTISPLKSLVSNFLTSVPIAVIIGAKGAGKTYTFLQVIRRRNWQDYVHVVDNKLNGVKAYVCPIVHSINLETELLTLVNDVRQSTAKELGLELNASIENSKNYILDSLRKDMHVEEWRERWLNVIAWSIGFMDKDEEAWKKLPVYLRERKQSIVAVIDGLEDLFQELSSNENMQTALRSLLQNVPIWLTQQPDRPIGLLVFVRQDMVLHSVRQNAAQLTDKYGAFALKWNAEEALRLIAWVANKAGVSDLSLDDIQVGSKSELEEGLIPLWGRKLAKENSNEARSADWVIAALSDLNGQIQARDVVRFLYNAASGSKSDKYWDDRLLAPAAIRSAVSACSGEKINETKKENEKLGIILNKLYELPEQEKRIPFSRESVQLSIEEMELLEDNGVVLREGEQYYMPEIYRLGLDFTYKSGARPRVLALSRRARKE